jgi:hypothetical protein
MRTETVTTTKTAKGKLPPAAKKRNAEILKFESGDSFTGTYKGQSTGPWLDRKTGETKDLTRLYFETAEGARVVIFQDSGLKNAMANSNVLEGEAITLVKLDKVSLQGGHTVNQWDIYSA